VLFDTDPELRLLEQLAGTWTTEATHPMVPGVVVHGTAAFEWVEGRRFLSLRATNDHPQFPGELTVIGHVGHDRIDDRGAPAGPAGPLKMYQFDSRGVFRICDVQLDERAWHWARMSPGFSQRFTGLFSADGNTIEGHSQLCRDDVHWADDLQITYRRQLPRSN
jgi:hypothetical protein